MEFNFSLFFTTGLSCLTKPALKWHSSPVNKKKKAVRSNSYMKIDHLFRHCAGMKERQCPVRDVINKPQNLP